MRAASRDYLPAFGKDFLLPFFDPQGCAMPDSMTRRTISNRLIAGLLVEFTELPFEFPGKLFTIRPH